MFHPVVSLAFQFCVRDDSLAPTVRLYPHPSYSSWSPCPSVPFPAFDRHPIRGCPKKCAPIDYSVSCTYVLTATLGLPNTAHQGILLLLMIRRIGSSSRRPRCLVSPRRCGGAHPHHRSMVRKVMLILMLIPMPRIIILLPTQRLPIIHKTTSTGVGATRERPVGEEPSLGALIRYCIGGMFQRRLERCIPVHIRPMNIIRSTMVVQPLTDVGMTTRRRRIHRKHRRTRGRGYEDGRITPQTTTSTSPRGGGPSLIVFVPTIVCIGPSTV